MSRWEGSCSEISVNRFISLGASPVTGVLVCDCTEVLTAGHHLTNNADRWTT